MPEFIYIEPNRSKGEGARNRENMFVELADGQGDKKWVRGTVVDDYGYALVRDYEIERDLCRRVSRAIKAPSGQLVVADNKLGR